MTTLKVLNTITALAAIAAITYLTRLALSLGYNSDTIILAFAGIAGAAGYSIQRLKPPSP